MVWRFWLKVGKMVQLSKSGEDFLQSRKDLFQAAGVYFNLDICGAEILQIDDELVLIRIADSESYGNIFTSKGVWICREFVEVMYE